LSPGQVPAAKNGQKPILLMMSRTKKTKPKTKIFFTADSKTYQVFWGFEQLSGAIGWGARLLV